MFSRQIFLLLCLLTLSSPLQAGDAAVVTVQPLDSLLFYPQQEAPATVISLNDTRLSVELSGIIEEIPVLVGQVVQQGDPLLHLDPWAYKNAIQQAEGALEESEIRLQLARRQQKRTAQLHKNGQASAELFDQRETELQTLAAQIKQQQTQLQMAQDRLKRVVLRAPFSGLITERMAQVGAYATPGLPLLRLIDTTHLELSAQLRPDQALLFNADWQGHFMVGEQTYPLQWRTTVAAQDPQTRTQELRLLLTGDKKPPPGAVGRLVWKSAHPHIPAWILIRRGGLLGLLLAEGEKAHFYPLPQAVEGQPTPVEGNLSGRVIISGREQLSDGDAIQIELAH